MNGPDTPRPMDSMLGMVHTGSLTAWLLLLELLPLAWLLLLLLLQEVEVKGLLLNLAHVGCVLCPHPLPTCACCDGRGGRWLALGVC